MLASLPNLQSEPKPLFLFGLRLGFGVWLLYLGLTKWILTGPGNFVGFITKQFSETWVPALMSEPLGWIIIILEPLLGLLLILGIRQRLVWLVTAKLMFMLMFGKSILKDFPGVADNWQYFVLALAAAALTEPSKKTA